MVDGGEGADSLNITKAALRTTTKGGSGDDSINITEVSEGLVEAQQGDDTINVTGAAGVTSASLKAGIGDDLFSISGGITDGSLFGGDGNDNFNFTGGGATGLIDTGSGVDSVLLAADADTVTLTGVLTSTTLDAGSGADSIVVKANVASGYFDLSAGAAGAADDTLNFLPSSVSILGTTIKGGAGVQHHLYGANDVVLDVASGDSVFGGAGADTLLFTGSVLNSSIQAGSGNDSIVMAGTGMTSNTIDGRWY